MQDNIPSYEYERWAEALEATGRYRVLRRIEAREDLQIGSFPSSVRRGLIVCLTTTGGHSAYDEVIELAMLPFTYCRDTARVYATSRPFAGLRQPSRALSADASRRTGLADHDIEGREIEADVLEPYVDEADLVIAHDAAQARPFAEALTGSFSDRAWACSMTQVPWRSEGYSGVGLDSLATENGLYLGSRRPVDQCHALLALLTEPRLRSGGSPLQALLWEARQPSYRIWADMTSIAAKAALRERGYHWHDATRGIPSAWWYDVSAGQLNDEIAWLHREIYGRAHPLRVDCLTARSRFSQRRTVLDR